RRSTRTHANAALAHATPPRKSSTSVRLASHHSITSSARASSVSGTMRPIMGRHLDVLTPPLQFGGDLVDQEHTPVFLVHVLSAAVVLVEDEFAAQAFARPFGKVAGEGLHEATLLCAHHSTKSWLVFAARAVCDGHHDFGLFRKSRTGSRKFQPKREELE